MNNVERCQIWSNETSCKVCHNLVEYKCSKLKDLNKKLDEVEAQLEQMNIKFLRISKSYLVNVNYVKEFRYEKVVMDDGKEFKIGPRYKDKIRKSYIELMRIS